MASLTGWKVGLTQEALFLLLGLVAVKWHNLGHEYSSERTQVKGFGAYTSFWVRVCSPLRIVGFELDYRRYETRN